MLGRCIKIETFCTGKRCMWICISGWPIDNLQTMCYGIITGCNWWCAGQRWCRLGIKLSVSGGWRCTSSFVSSVYQQILCGAILARKASGCVVLMNHSQVFFYRSLHLFMPQILNTPLLLFSDLGTSCLDLVFHFFNCGARTAVFGHFGHIQG